MGLQFYLITLVFNLLFVLQLVASSRSIKSTSTHRITLQCIDQLSIFKSNSGLATKSNLLNSEDSIPQYPDLFYEYRLTSLNNKTPLDLEFRLNVKKYILLYSTQRREQVSKVLGLSEYYMPIFEEYLDKYGLPLELKYIPIVESALNPLARSTSGAMGLWQFKLNSAKMFDLKVDSYIDERCDPIKSTEAACKYLKYLYGIFNDWNLAIASYNTGPGAIRNMLERNNGKFKKQDIYNYLPDEAKNYISAFIAVNYIMNYYKEHQIVAAGTNISFYETDTIQIVHPVYFSQISENIGVTIDILEFLNPQYKLNYIPANGEAMNLVLPTGYIVSFIQSESDIYGTNDGDLKRNIKEKSTPKKTWKKTYVVKKGEFLHKIALKYHCTIEEIKHWNSLDSDILHEGQSLIIYIERNTE